MGGGLGSSRAAAGDPARDPVIRCPQKRAFSDQAPYMHRPFRLWFPKDPNSPFVLCLYVTFDHFTVKEGRGGERDGAVLKT